VLLKRHDRVRAATRAHAQHGLKESDGVLETGVESRNSCGIPFDELPIQEDRGHAAR
jgi:hypothetical protein